MVGPLRAARRLRRFCVDVFGRGRDGDAGRASSLKRAGFQGIEALEARQLLSGLFLAKVDYPAGGGPLRVMSDDFNRDDKADLVVVNYSSDTVSVLLNDGNGGFASKNDYATGSHPWWATSADLNSDDRADLAVVNYDSNTMSVLLNDGDGTFAAKVDYDTDRCPSSVTAADFNGDGRNDLAVTNHLSGTVSVFLNQGGGTFAIAADYQTEGAPQGMSWADLNGDGRADLAVANYISNTVSVLLQKGNGTFAAKVDYAAGDGPSSVIPADFNGDGKADLAVAGLTVGVLLNKGNGTFSKIKYYYTGARVSAVAAGDFDGNGRVDLATAHHNEDIVSVLLNKGNGDFAAKVDYATGDSPNCVISADLNDDGIADLATANSYGNSVSVLLRRPRPAPIYITKGKHPYYALIPGYKWEYERKVNGTRYRAVVTVSKETQLVDGVVTRVLKQQDYRKSAGKWKLVSVGRSYVAINKRNGDVVSFGWDGRFLFSGTWYAGGHLAGEDGNKAGVLVAGHPEKGVSFGQFFERGEDKMEGLILSTKATVRTPAGTFKNCLKIMDYLPEHPDWVYYRYFAPGVGEIANEQIGSKLTKFTRA